MMVLKEVVIAFVDVLNIGGDDMVEKLEEFSIVLGVELVPMFVDERPDVSEVEATISLEGDILVEVLISGLDDCEV